MNDRGFHKWIGAWKLIENETGRVAPHTDHGEARCKSCRICCAVYKSLMA